MARTTPGWRLVAWLLACAACGRAGTQPGAGAPAVAAERQDVAADDGDPLAAAAIVADVAWLCAEPRAGRGSYQVGSAETARWVAAQMEAIGLEVIRQPVSGGGIDNVIGIHRGGARAVLVTAHYDHLGVSDDGIVYPGADDNASGTAVLLALARDAVRREYRDTLVFIAFAAEEAGLVGSRAYVAEPAWPIEETAAVVNFDMVGRDFFESGADRPAAAGVIGLEADPEARRAAMEAAEAAGLALVPAPARLLEVFGSDFRTDEWWFRRRGVPSIHFSTGMHDDYHQPGDTPDKLVPGQLERVARTAAGLLRYLAGATGKGG